MEFHIIIPARYHSTRLPGKVLMDIHNKPMVQHVFERAIESGAESVTIATDDERVAEACKKFDATVCMTSIEHQTGTERIAEVVADNGYAEEDIIVCLQGDEPLMRTELIFQVAQNLSEHDQVKVATIATPLHDLTELADPNIVKVVLNHRNYAMYFSRAPIPWDRDHQHPTCYYRHIGLYAYHAAFLETYVNWPQPPIEKLESLEQLRVLWNGHKIHVGITELEVPPGVDTLTDLERVRGKM